MGTSYTLIYSFSKVYQPIFRLKTAIVSKECINVTFSIKKDKVAKFDLAKIGQGQPRVIILTNYNWQQSPMIHTKFR